MTTRLKSGLLAMKAKTLLDAALIYMSHDWSISPCEGGIALPTGRVSGVIVLEISSDADLEGLEDALPRSPVIFAAGGVAQFFFRPRHDDWRSRDIALGVRLHGDGDHVVLPGNETEPQWSRFMNFRSTPLADMPEQLSVTFIEQSL
jgi:hypothetical protein